MFRWRGRELSPSRKHRRSRAIVLFILLGATIVSGALASGCGGETADQSATAGVSSATPTSSTTAAEERTEVPAATETSTAEPAAGTPGVESDNDGTDSGDADTDPGAGTDGASIFDPSLARHDVDCSREFVSSGGGEAFPEGFVTAHYVVGGVLGEACLGEIDERLVWAWRLLRLVASPADLEPLILFAGYVAPESDLLAYVEALTAADGSVAFQMTVNLGESEDDDIELALTMAHEFTHVFTGVEEQLDRGVDESVCTTYFEGDGCYTDDSYIARWIDAFWEEWIHEVDPVNPDDVAAAERCDVDPSFLGAYAATNPEEDFAETFSAYVFSVPVEDPGLQAKYAFFDAEPGLAKYRTRVQEAGIDPFPNIFEGCGPI